MIHPLHKYIRPLYCLTVSHSYNFCLMLSILKHFKTRPVNGWVVNFPIWLKTKFWLLQNKLWWGKCLCYTEDNKQRDRGSFSSWCFFPWTLQSCLDKPGNVPWFKKKQTNKKKRRDPIFRRRGQIDKDKSEGKGATGRLTSRHLGLASPLIKQWTGAGVIGPWWGTPSSQVASPAKNVQVAAPHAIGALVKSTVGMGVTKNPSRPFHHQGMFYCLFYDFGIVCSGCTMLKHELLTDDRERDMMECRYFSTLSTRTFAVLHASTRGQFSNRIDYLGVENLQTRFNCRQQIGDKITSGDVGLLLAWPSSEIELLICFHFILFTH